MTEEQPTHALIIERLGNLEIMVSTRLTTIEGKVDEAKEIVEAWGAARQVGRFVKWSGAIAAAVVAIMLFVKHAAAAFVR